MAARGYIPSSEIGMAEFGLGLKAEAFKHFEEAYEERSGWLLYMKAFPAFEPIEADARFARILARMGLVSP